MMNGNNCYTLIIDAVALLRWLLKGRYSIECKLDKTVISGGMVVSILYVWRR